MKKTITILVFLLAVAALTYGAHLECAAAKYGFTNTNPTTIGAKTLWDNGFELTQTERGYIANDDDTWWVGYENPTKNFDYLICLFRAVDDPEETTCNWQVGLDHPSEIATILWWNNSIEDRTWAGENDGGYEPPKENTDVNTGMSQAIDILIIMICGYTPGAGNWIKADVVDIDCTQ